MTPIITVSIQEVVKYLGSHVRQTLLLQMYSVPRQAYKISMKNVDIMHLWERLREN